MRVEKLKFPKLIEYKDTYLYLIWIMDVIKKRGSNDIRYRCLFKTLPDGLPKEGLSNEDLKKGLYIIEELYPEFLGFFSIGKIYYYTEDNAKPPLNYMSSGIENERILDVEFRPEKMEVRNAGEDGIIPDVLYNLSHKFYSNKRGTETDFTKEIKHQYVVVTYYNDYEIITPSFVIAPSFYFTSTKIRKKILSPRFKFSDLYYNIGSSEQGVPFIMLRKNMSDFDIPFIYYFATHEYASKQAEKIMTSIVAQEISSYREAYHIPLKLLFPFKHHVRARIRGLVCEKCRKILVEDIQILHSKDFFGFDKIIVEYSYSREKEITEILISDRDSDNMVTYDRSPKNKKSHPKNIEYRSEIVYEQVKKGFEKVKVIRKNISEEEGRPFHNTKFVNKREDTKRNNTLTVDASPHYKDSKVKPAELRRTIEEVSAKVEEGIQFNLSDFEKMVNVLKEQNFVSIKTYEPVEIPVKEFHLSNKKAYYDDGTARKFSVVDVTIDDKGRRIHASLVEVDQVGLKKGISTYVLVWPDDSERHVQIINNLLLLYFQGNKFMVIRNALRECCNAILIRKNHPEEKSGKSYLNWGNRLVEKIRKEAEGYSLNIENK